MASPSTFNVVFIGAGAINFGTPRAPWNHSTRLEKVLGSRLQVVAIIDPALSRAKDVLDVKLEGPASACYSSTVLCPDISSYSGIAPHAIFIGTPPAFRGTIITGRDIEVVASKKFPSAALFVEKPISSALPEYVQPLIPHLKDTDTFAAVGYMLRYLKVVQKLKAIIAEKNIVVASTNAWFQSTYNLEDKAFWWNKAESCGPIVEQATHLCDLSRYIAGNVSLPTVRAVAVEHNVPPGQLSSLPTNINESEIPPQERLPRVTSAIWKYHSGAIGSLTHSLLLHGKKYQTQLSVFADGYSFRLVDLYSQPKLFVRTPDDDNEVLYEWEDDPYFAQIQAFVSDVESGNTKRVLSTFEDALQTYEFTWAIRTASENR